MSEMDDGRAASTAPDLISGLRRSIAFAAMDRYATGALNLVTMLVLARLLTPADVGLVALAIGIVMMLESFRDFGIGAYLVQEREITRTEIRTAFTVGFALTLGVAAALFAAAHPLASLYGDPRLALVLQWTTLGVLAAPWSSPVVALLRRDMAFDAVALINIVNAIVNCVLAVALAALGCGFMSLVWSSVAAAVASAIVALRYCPGWWVFRPTLVGWSKIFAFGGYSSLTVLLNTLFTALPTVLLGRVAGLDAVGLYNRALLLCQLPERLIVNALQPVILPAFSARTRAGGDLKEAYLRGLGMMTAVQWPFLVCLALLADPFVNLVLGEQWSGAAPLVRLLALASGSIAPAFLTFPVLVSIGRIKDTLTASLISLPPSMAVVCAAVFLGPEALAASLFITGPLQVYVAMRVIRRHLRFSWADVMEAVARPVVITACAAVAPGGVVLVTGFRPDLPFVALMTAGLGAAAGWIVGLFATGHPLAAELHGIGRSAAHMAKGVPFLLSRSK